MTKKLFFYRATVVAPAALAVRLSARLTESADASKRSLTKWAQSVCAGPVIGIAPGAGVVRGQTIAVGLSMMGDYQSMMGDYQGELTGFGPEPACELESDCSSPSELMLSRRSGPNTNSKRSLSSPTDRRAKRHPDCLYFDQTHLSIDGSGAREIAWIVDQAVHRLSPNSGS